MFNGKMKAVTFSFDDGITQDIRLIEIFNKYGLRGTFNINSGLFGREGTTGRDGRTTSYNRLKKEDIKQVYEGHEVGAHTLTHPNLPDFENEADIIHEVEEDRLALSELVGYEVVGMAYPSNGLYKDKIAKTTVQNKTGIKYGRDIFCTYGFDMPKDLYAIRGTAWPHPDWDKMNDLADKFLAAEAERPMLFYIWGHSCEFDLYPERWELFDEFCKKISGKDDVFYGTNKEVLLGE